MKASNIGNRLRKLEEKVAETSVDPKTAAEITKWFHKLHPEQSFIDFFCPEEGSIPIPKHIQDAVSRRLKKALAKRNYKSYELLKFIDNYPEEFAAILR